MYRKEIFTKRLREAREYRGLSQKELADLLNMQSAGYGKYELGKIELSASLLPIIANFERININFFFDDEINIKDADLDLRHDDKAINILTKEIQEIKQKIIEPNKIKSKALNKIIESLGQLNEDALNRFEYIVNAYIQSELNRNEQPEKKRSVG